jgi:hypothetical protein
MIQKKNQKSKLQMILTISLTVVFLLFSNLSPVFADYYVFEKGGNNYYTAPQVIKNPERKQYLYGILSPGNIGVDYYEFSLNDNVTDFSIELLLSENEKSKLFKPTLVFVDPYTSQSISDVFIGFPSGQKGRVYSWEENGEFDTNEVDRYISGVKIERNFSAGTYRLAIYDPQGQGGRYVIKIGAIVNPENLLEKAMSIINILRIKLLLY